MNGIPNLPLLRRLRYRLGRRIRQNPYRLLKSLVEDGLPIETVIHCGAHLAQERFYYEALGVRRIVWVEGSPEIHADLTASLDADRRAGKLKSEHVTVNALLYSEEGRELALHGFSNEGQSNSIFRAAEGFARRWPQIGETGRTEQLVSTTLDRIAADILPEGADLVVLDLQGAELEVLKGGVRTLAGAKAAICEVSKVEIYQGGARYLDILSAFGDAGFIDMHRAHTCGDLLFVRRDVLEAR